MFIEQDFYFWKVTHDLVLNQGFEVLHINTEHKEAWLEYSGKWKNHVIRIKYKQINWRNELKRDLQVTYQQLKQNRQIYRGGNVILHTIYVSEFPPVEEWENVVSEMNKDKKLNVHLYYFSDENKDNERKRFYEALRLEEPMLEQRISHNEMEAMIPYLKQQIVSSHRKKQQEVQSLFQFGKPQMTYILLAVNILLFMFVESQGSTTSVSTLIEFGAKYNPAIMEGEWWRIGSSMFLHIGLLHLLMNMLALYYIGIAVERIYGTWRFSVIYLLAGIFGGVASFMLNPHVAAGASGAIFGLFGALLYFGVRHRQLFFKTMGWNLIFVIVLNIAFGIMVPQVDNGAHMGGLIGGFIASTAFNLPKRNEKLIQGIALTGYIVILGTMAFIGSEGVFNDGERMGQVQQTQDLNESGDYTQVVSITTEALADPGRYEAELRFNRSYAYNQLSKPEKAIEDLKKVVELSPDMGEAHYNLALLYQQKGEKNKAIKHARTAVDLRPENQDFQELTEELQ